MKKDTYSLVLWAKENSETKQEQIQKIYEILSALTAFGDPFCPNYLPAKRKAECKSFTLNHDNIELLLKKSRKKEELDKKLGVGKTVGFFSSLMDNESSGINITIGNSNSRLKNTIVIDFPIDFDFKIPGMLDRLEELFKELVRIFKPYWGCISSYMNSQQYNGYYNHEKNIPNAVFWMNYWNEDLAEYLKLSKKISNGETAMLYTVEACQIGYFLRLQKQPININEENESNIQRKINDIFKL